MMVVLYRTLDYKQEERSTEMIFVCISQEVENVLDS